MICDKIILLKSIGRISEMKDYILDNKKKVENTIQAINKRTTVISMARLVVFLAAFVLLAIGLSKRMIVLSIAAVILFIVFMYLVKIHSDMNEELIRLKAKSTVLRRYLMRLTEEWKSFRDTGEEFRTNNNHKVNDLDLLGRSSIYQLISIAHTNDGRKKLADTLSLNVNHIDKVEQRYEAISELSNDKDFLIDSEAVSEAIIDIKKKDIEKREAYLADFSEDEKNKELKEIDTFPVWMYLLMFLVPVMTLSTIVVVLLMGLHPGIIIIAFFAGLFLTWMPKGIQDSMIDPVNKYGPTASDLSKLLKIIDDSEFNAEILKDIKSRVSGKEGVIAALKSLNRISDVNNISYNPIVHMVLAGFTGWDYFIALAAFKWNKKNKGIVEDCLDIIGDMEELGSLALLSVIRSTTKPEIVRDGSIKIDAEDLYHPLIETNRVVSNSASLDNCITIITGSNMSGKTTFLRTLAVNMVLAYTGAGVCGKSFSIPYARIFTSMRISDDVSNGISTFYAEILRIKEMTDYIKSGNEVPALCFIDEIFKGTNSADRIVGAEKAVKKLSSGNSMVILTTHDFELCDLKSDSGKDVDNYHFEEYYENGELRFDYTIKNGRCTTRNAMTILEMAGLL